MKRAKKTYQNNEAEEEFTLADVISDDGISSDDSLCDFIEDFKPKKKKFRKQRFSITSGDYEIPCSTPFKSQTEKAKFGHHFSFSPIGKQNHNAAKGSAGRDSDSENDSSDIELSSLFSDYKNLIQSNKKQSKWNLGNFTAPHSDKGKSPEKCVLQRNAAKFGRSEKSVPVDTRTRVKHNKNAKEEVVNLKKQRLGECIENIKMKKKETQSLIGGVLDAFDFALLCLRRQGKLPTSFNPTANPETATTSQVGIKGQFHGKDMKKKARTVHSSRYTSIIGSPRNKKTQSKIKCNANGFQRAKKKRQPTPVAKIERYNNSGMKEVLNDSSLNIRRSGRARKSVERQKCVIMNSNVRFVNHFNNITREYGFSDTETSINCSVENITGKQSPNKSIKKTRENSNYTSQYNSLTLKNDTLQSPTKLKAIVNDKRKDCRQAKQRVKSERDLAGRSSVSNRSKEISKNNVLERTPEKQISNICGKVSPLKPVKGNKALSVGVCLNNKELGVKSGVLEIQPDGEKMWQCSKYCDIIYRVNQGKAHMTVNDCHCILQKNESIVVHKGSWYSIKNTDKRKKLSMHVCELLY